jgi:hypothetical protein
VHADERLHSPTGSVYRFPPKCDDYRKYSRYDGKRRNGVCVTKKYDVGTIREKSMMQAGFLREDMEGQNSC